LRAKNGAAGEKWNWLEPEHLLGAQIAVIVE
jgi:hypothetical protein